MFHKADAIRTALYGFFHAAHALVDDGCSVFWRWDVLLKFLILSEGSRDERPRFWLQFKGILFPHEPIKVIYFEFLEFPEEIFLGESGHNAFIEL